VSTELSLAAPLELAGAHRILLTQGAAGDELKIWSTASEQPLLVVSVSEAGVAVRVCGATVTIEATELLKLEAKRLVLSALEELSLQSAGTANIAIAGDLAVTAAAQTLTATEGEIHAQANDDIRLDGERVLLNCDS
jgi:hypothetical protein